MRKLTIAIILIMFIFTLQVFSPQVSAGTFYLHDHPSYWWYMVSEPRFSVVVPSTAQNYLERSVFGMNMLEVVFEGGAISMEIATLKDTSVAAVRQSIEERFKPVVRNINVTSNREITTSNNLQTFFYSFEATGQAGKKVMLRSVIFENGNTIVSLSLFLDADKYVDDVREYWLRAVNEFEWN